MLTVLATSNYRSLRKLIVLMRGLNVITGANGSGKPSLYRALRLLTDTAQGSLPSLAREGGLQSTLWAGLMWPSAGSCCTLIRVAHPAPILVWCQRECHTLGLSVPLVEEENHQSQVEQHVGIEGLSFCEIPTDWHMGQLDYLGRVGHGGLFARQLPAGNYEE